MNADKYLKQLSIDEKLNVVLDELLAIKGRLSSIESRIAAQAEQQKPQSKSKDSTFGCWETHE